MATFNSSASRRVSNALPVALAAVLAACGSGGGGTGAPASNGGPATTPPAAAAFVRMWSPNYNQGEMRAWSYASLQADRTDDPDVVVILPAGTRPNAATFDATGAMWVTDNANNRLLKFSRDQIQISGTPTPRVVIDTDGTSLRAPIGLAFDRLDNLWVAVDQRIEKYVPSNLDNSGPTTPNGTISATGFQFPADITFDAAGNLWLSNASTTVANNAVFVFTPSQQTAGGLQTPRLKLQSLAFALIEGLRFDAAGALWVASNDGLNVARFAATSVALPLAAETRTLVPEASLEADANDTALGRTVRKPGGMVFDRDGNLWINSERGTAGDFQSGLVRFTSAQRTFIGPRQVLASVLVRNSTSNPGFGGMCLEL